LALESILNVSYIANYLLIDRTFLNSINAVVARSYSNTTIAGAVLCIICLVNSFLIVAISFKTAAAVLASVNFLVRPFFTFSSNRRAATSAARFLRFIFNGFLGPRVG
jgi:ABC-type glycerol-3-phosphate transport system permease component